MEQITIKGIIITLIITIFIMTISLIFNHDFFMESTDNRFLVLIYSNTFIILNWIFSKKERIT